MKKIYKKIFVLSVTWNFATFHLKPLSKQIWCRNVKKNFSPRPLHMFTCFIHQRRWIICCLNFSMLCHKYCGMALVLKTSPISTIIIIWQSEGQNWADADQKQIHSEHSLNKYIHKVWTWEWKWLIFQIIVGKSETTDVHMNWPRHAHQSYAPSWIHWQGQ